LPAGVREGRDHVDRPLDAAAPTLEHAAPVPEAVLEKLVRRDDGDRLVPVLHLHRVQRDVDDIPVGAELRHLDPVADADQIVVGELNAGHERQQRVAEDQRDDRHHRAETADEVPRRLVREPRDDEDDGDDVDHHLRHLHVALDRPHLGGRRSRVERLDH
jgi:hypothetical protein